MRILVVDDDAGIQMVLRDFFDRHGGQTVFASDRRSMECHLAGPLDLVLLDMRLGSEDGLDLLRVIRNQGDLPVIIITAHRPDEVDRIVGLELGADDYIPKPFGLQELLARVRAVLRRTESAKRSAPAGVSSFDGWKLNRRFRTLRDPRGDILKLTKGEYALLVAFLDMPGKALDRETLLQATRIQEDVFDRSIDVQILRLRRKIEVDPSDPKYIVTLRGAGYMFVPHVIHQEKQ